jgi:arylformamidase
MDRLIDLSHVLEPGMPSYPGLPEPQFLTVFTHEESEARGAYAPGTTFQIARYELGGNTGTYIDSPFHRHPGAQDMADLPLEKLANLQGVLVEAAREGPVGPERFEGLDLHGKAVLVHTGWSDLWDSGDYFRSGPYLPAETCEWLVKQGAALVGIDCANIDNMKDPARPAHTILLAAGIPIVEHLTNLDRLRVAVGEGSFRFFAVPPAIRGGTSFAVRAFATVAGT